MKAFQDYVPVLDLYWATRWGREGNPPKSRMHRLGWRAGSLRHRQGSCCPSLAFLQEVVLRPGAAIVGEPLWWSW